MVEEAGVKTFLITFIIGSSLFIMVWNPSMDLEVWESSSKT
jgi:hypothetical protein